MGKLDVAIPQGDEPLLTFTAVVRDRFGVDTPIDLTGSSISWVSKPTVMTLDGSGTTISGSIVAPAINGVFTVQLTSAVTTTAGNYVYKVVVTKNGHPLTVQYGSLWVTDT